MAGESWKSHKNTALERDMSADHDAQMDQWLDEQLGPGPAEVARLNADDLARWQQGLGYPPDETDLRRGAIRAELEAQARDVSRRGTGATANRRCGPVKQRTARDSVGW